MFGAIEAAANSATAIEVDVLGDLAADNGGFLDSIVVIPHPVAKPTWGDSLKCQLVDGDDAVIRDFGTIAIDPDRQTMIYTEEGSEGTYVPLPSGSKVRLTYTNVAAISEAKVLVNCNAVSY